MKPKFTELKTGRNFIGQKYGCQVTSSTSVQFSSVTQSCLTLCDPMNRSTPDLPVHHQLPEFTQTQVHRVGDAIQPSHPLSSPSPPAPLPLPSPFLFSRSPGHQYLIISTIHHLTLGTYAYFCSFNLPTNYLR